MPSRRATPCALLCAVLLLAEPGAPPSRAALQPAPRFKATDIADQRLDLTELLKRGPVLLDFWATWCRPCLESIPELERWHKAYGPRGLTVVGVSVDGPRNFAKVRPMAASKGISYHVVIDVDGRLQRLYQVVAVPTAFLIDTSGAIARVRVAYRPGEGDALEREIRALLPPEADTE